MVLMVKLFQRTLKYLVMMLHCFFLKAEVVHCYCLAWTGWTLPFGGIMLLNVLGF